MAQMEETPVMDVKNPLVNECHCYLVLVGVSWNTAESNLAEEFIVTTNQSSWERLNQQLGFLRDHT